MTIRKPNNLQITSLLVSALLLHSLLPSARGQDRGRPVTAVPPVVLAQAKPNGSGGDRRMLRKPILAALTSGLPGQSTTLLPDGRTLTLGGTAAGGVVGRALLKEPKGQTAAALPVALRHARAWHTATVLPDGSVLVFGGVDAKGLVREAERFDPAMQSFAAVDTVLEARAWHTATLLTDGRVLLAGGVGKDGKPLASLELWDPQANRAQTLAAALLAARRAHTAALESDGSVLMKGGVLADGSSAVQNERFVPETGTSAVAVESVPVNSVEAPRVSGSIPAEGAADVAVNAWLSLRFSKLLRPATVTAGTFRLTGPEGPLTAKVTAAENGRLVFVLPAQPLQPSTSYALSVSGPTDWNDLAPAPTEIHFTTSADAKAADGTSSTAGKPEPEDPILPPLQAPPGTTALSGTVHTVSGKFLPDVTLELNCGESKEKRNQTQADKTGRFLLTGEIPAGHCKLLIDGYTGHYEKQVFGRFTAGVEITKGITNVLPYVIWMTPLDVAHAVTIPSPTPGEFVVTNPALPGLELRLPPKATIKDYDGKVVTQLTITRIPITRPPFPLPGGIGVPFYFTIQPGGAYIEVTGDGPKGARLFYPNQVRAPAGLKVSFWNYDPDGKGWFVYGKGTVDTNRKYIVPDPGVLIYQFTGAMVADPQCNTCGPNPPPPYPGPDGPDGGGGSPPDGPGPVGDPVDPGSGLFLYGATDFTISDTIPLKLARTYRQSDPISRPFGVGISHNYELSLVGDRNPWTYVDLILPDGSRVHYVNTAADKTNAGNAIYVTTQYSALYKTTIVSANGGWLLTLHEGGSWQFPTGDGATFQAQTAPLWMTDRFDNKVTFTRDPATGNLLKATSPNGRWISFTYDSANRITTATDNSGRQYQYSYDAGGRLATVTDPMNSVVQYTYDYNNQMLTILDPRGNTYVTNQYDANGRVTQQTMADGGIWQYAYTQDANGNIVQTDITNPRGFVERLILDTNGYFSGGRITADIRGLGRPEQQTTTYARDPATGFLQSITDALNRQTTYTYDASGNVLTTTRLAGTSTATVTSSTYQTAFNLRTSSTNPLNHTTFYTYDAAGKPMLTTDPLGNQTSYTYNPAGQPLTVTRPSGTIRFGYTQGDVTQTTSPGGNTSTFVPDTIGHLISATDPLGNSARSSYNAVDLPVQLTDALNNTFSVGYDAAKNAIRITDPRTNVFQYSYESLNRNSSRTDPLSPPGVTIYQYDQAGNLVHMTDRRGFSTNASYDALNRLSVVTFGDNSTISYTYDAGNRPTQIVDSLFGTITRTYDGLDHMLTETSPQGTITYTYDAAGRGTSSTVTGQQTALYSYDDADRLTQITQGGAIATFTYDSAGRRTSLTLPGGISVTQSYDADSRVTELRYLLGTTLLGNLTHTYDQDGRITSLGGTWARTSLPPALTSPVYNVDNQLTQWTGSTLAYDANGNLISDGTNSYIWNARDQLASISGPGLSASFSYDAAGRRAAKTINGTTTSFLYDGKDVVQETVGGTVTAQMLRSLSVDEVLLRTDSLGTQAVLSDTLGSTVALVDTGTGTVGTQYTYEPFGSTLTSGPASSNAFRFTGREDDGTGLYYYRARYYSPRLQRFLSEDPLDFKGSANLYADVAGDPINSRDPSGLMVMVCMRGAWGNSSAPLWNQDGAFGNHGYFWNTLDGDNCGRGADNHPHGREGGPSAPGTVCVNVEGSQGLENDLMGCCRFNTSATIHSLGIRQTGTGVLIPLLNDCWKPLKGCVAKSGLKWPGGLSPLGMPCPNCPNLPRDPSRSFLRTFGNWGADQMSPEGFESCRMWMQESMCQSGRRSFLRRLALGFSALTGCARAAPVPPHLFACDERDLSAIAKSAVGHEMYPDKIQRSSSGDHVTMLVSGRPSERRLLVVSMKRPATVLQPPGAFWAIADDLTFVAWRDSDTELHFRNGFVQETPRLAMPSFAPGSEFYSIAGPDNITRVYATRKPGVPMARVDFVTQEIFSKGDRVYLFGFDRNSKELGIVGSVFRNVSGTLSRESEIRIRPLRSAAVFAVVDLDPRSNQLLCADSRDEFGAKWFIYDLQSRVLADIGDVHPFGVFLQDDLIKLLRSSMKAGDSVA